MLDALRMKERSRPNLIAAIPQFANTAFRHVVMAAASKCRNSVTRQDRNAANWDYRNIVTTESNLTTMRCHRIREMTD
jgi:hypothetical protein